MNRIDRWIAFLALPASLCAYTDPGTGVFLYQAFMAAVVGFGWTARRALRRLFEREHKKTGLEG